MMNLLQSLEENPIIAALRDDSQLGTALESPCSVLFLLSANINTIEDVMKEVHKAGKTAFIHLDLMAGVSRDADSIEFLKKQFAIDGIITTHSSVVRIAKEKRIPCVQRLFMIDSQSLRTGTQSVLQTKPDAVEIMPGIMPSVVRAISEATQLPIIAGGLVNTKKEVISVLDAGAIGVSTGAELLWHME